MTPKEQLLKAIETAPEPILVKVLDFLNFLKSQQVSINGDVADKTSHTMTLPPKDLCFRDLAGMFHDPQRKPVTLEEMDQAIREGALESL